MILGFHGGLVAVILLLFHYLLGDALATDLLLDLGLYTGLLSAVNITAFIPMFFLNKIYREIQMTYRLARNPMNRVGQAVALGTVAFVVAVAVHYGFSADPLSSFVMELF